MDFSSVAERLTNGTIAPPSGPEKAFCRRYKTEIDYMRMRMRSSGSQHEYGLYMAVLCRLEHIYAHWAFKV
jgi:hypothetical protein